MKTITPSTPSNTVNTETTDTTTTKPALEARDEDFEIVRACLAPLTEEAK
jgi:hypothetical protein